MPGITNAALAQQISELVTYWRTRDLEFAEWLGGTPTGGPYGDGRYALTDYLGVTQYLYCPAALESGVTSSASSAAVQAALASASKATALIAQAAAEAARDLTLSYRNSAQAARDAAQLAQSNAANNEANALVHRNKSKSWASNQEDVVVESGLYSARHYAAKAAGSLSSLASGITAATTAAVATATNAAAASASAAGSSATAAAGSATSASTSTTAAAASASAASGSAGAAAGSASAAAASAALAATFDPTLFVRRTVAQTITGALTFTQDLVPSGSIDLGNASTRWRDLYVSGGVRDAGANGYMLSSSGTAVMHGAGSIWTAHNFYTAGALRASITGSSAAFNVPALINGGVSSALELRQTNNGPWALRLSRDDTAFSALVYNNGSGWGFNSPLYSSAFYASGDTIQGSGKIQSYGWDGAYYNGHGIALGVSGGASYVHSYNAANGTYPKLYLAASVVELTANSNFYANGKDTINTTDGWLRLNQSGHYGNGVHTPGRLNVASYCDSDTDFRAPGYRFNGDTSFYIWNTTAYTYGSWRFGGARNGYTGIIIETGNNPTLMSSGGNTIGVYMQSAGFWSWYDNGSTFQIYRQLTDSNGGAYSRFPENSNARFYIRQGGSGVGSVEGDVTLVW
jgi:hypothetical protein